MRKPLTKKETILGTGFLLVLGLIFFRDEISASDLYRRTFHAEQYGAQQRAESEFIAKLDALNYQECAILINARRAILPLDLERDLALGTPRDLAQKRIDQDFVLDQKLCDEHGISPYSRPPNRD